MRLPSGSGNRPIHTMPRLIQRPTLRRALPLVLLAAALAAVCPTARATPPQTLPANLPTTLPTAPLAATPVTEAAALHADVTFAGGLLTVRANDSSLLQILRSISRRTGMKITGGVADQRVFGDYGPAPPSTILATLIDGTGVNMLLREGTADTPLELILSPRTGGASPPGIDMAVRDQDSETPPAPAPQTPSNTPPLRSDRRPYPGDLQPPNPGSVPPSMPQPANNINGSENNTTPTASEFQPAPASVSVDSLPTPATTEAPGRIVDSPNPPPADSTTGTSPNGVKTPEQIYQQLLQMQQQQQQPKPPQ